MSKSVSTGTGCRRVSTRSQ